jgi:chromosome segregation ATPase
MNRFVSTIGIALALLVGTTGIVLAQTVNAEDYGQRVSNAIDKAKKEADQLNARNKALLDAIREAGDPGRAQKVLDELINSASGALEPFGESSELMKEISNLLAFIESRRKNAEEELAKDPRWRERVEAWKKRLENIRELRQSLLGEGDRAKGHLKQIEKDRKFIQDLIAEGAVVRAKAEMERALQDLKTLGDTLGAAAETARRKDKAIGVPGS